MPEIAGYFAPDFFSPFYFSLFGSTSGGPSGNANDANRYFAPDFFSGFYFPSLAAQGRTTVGATNDANRYFTPNFFSPYYFPSLTTSGPQLVDLQYRDRDAFSAMVATLASTGVFSDVLFGTKPDRMTAGADLSRVAVISPEDWVEIDDADPNVVVRHVSFSLSLIVRDENPEWRFDELDRLSCIALNALDGSNLGGGSLPSMTRLRRGRYDANSRHPEQRLEVLGEFTYLIASPISHSTHV